MSFWGVSFCMLRYTAKYSKMRYPIFHFVRVVPFMKYQNRNLANDGIKLGQILAGFFFGVTLYILFSFASLPAISTFATCGQIVQHNSHWKRACWALLQ